MNDSLENKQALFQPQIQSAASNWIWWKWFKLSGTSASITSEHRPRYEKEDGMRSETGFLSSSSNVRWLHDCSNLNRSQRKLLSSCRLIQDPFLLDDSGEPLNPRGSRSCHISTTVPLLLFINAAPHVGLVPFINTSAVLVSKNKLMSNAELWRIINAGWIIKQLYARRWASR